MKEKAIPVVVISSRIDLQDLPALKEIGVAAFREKPIDQQKIIELVIEVARQLKRPRTLDDAKRLILEHLARHERQEAAAIRMQMLQDDSIGQGEKSLLDAEIAYFDEAYEAARQLAVAGLMKGCDSLPALSLIGKIFLKLHDFSAATAFLEKARSFSPANIERLCLLAEAYDELEAHDKSRDTLDACKRLDPGHEQVIETELKLALRRGRIDEAKRLMATLHAFDDMVSFINNKAIVMSVTGRTDEGVQLYRRALQSVPNSRPDVRATLLYNLALAFVRKDLLDEAIFHLEQCPDVKSAIGKKIQDLYHKLDAARKAGRKIRLADAANLPPAKAFRGATSDRAKASVEKVGYNLGVSMILRPGDLGCYKLFFALPEDSAVCDGMLRNMPQYLTRPQVKKNYDEPLSRRS